MPQIQPDDPLLPLVLLICIVVGLLDSFQIIPEKITKQMQYPVILSMQINHLFLIPRIVPLT